MKVKNEYVLIKTGEKQIKLQNTILDTYIKKIVENQTLINNRNELKMNYVYLKFDNELEFTESTDLKSTDFNLCFPFDNYYQNIGNSLITLNYNYTNISSRFKFYDTQESNTYSSMSRYGNKKITAIGFGVDGTRGEVSIYACVDTSNYNLYTGELDKILSITRRDIFSTDGYFYCSSKKVLGPVHMIDDYNNSYFAVPVSIGLGVNMSQINQEKILLPYSNNLLTSEFQIDILKELVVEYKNNGLFPLVNLYPNMELYPARIITTPTYPAKNIYPGNKLYPVNVPYQFFIIKYEIYNNNEDTGDYYLIGNLINMDITEEKTITEKIIYKRA